MKLYLIILIVIFLLVALSCKDKPEITESFQNNDVNFQLKQLRKEIARRSKAGIEIIKKIDKNNDNFIEKKEVRKQVEKDLDEKLEKQKAGELVDLSDYSEEKKDEYLNKETNRRWKILQQTSESSGKAKIDIEKIKDGLKKMEEKAYKQQAEFIRNIIKDKVAKEERERSARKQKRSSIRRRRSAQRRRRSSAERRRRRSAERRRRRSAERKRRSAERRRRQRGKSSKNKGKDCINDNKSFGISCKSQPGKNSFKCVIDKTTGNLAKASEIGKNLTTSNEVPKKVTKADSQKQIAELKKKIENQNKKINNLDSKVTNSTDKYFASVKNRDSKLLEANDGVKPIDPSNFSFKPNIEFKHKEPSRKIASAYGWSFMPPHYWSVPQKRPPACIPSKKNTATVTPIYDKSVPVDVMDYTQVGSILPKFEYNEVHNPNYYYPGWIAKKDEPYPGKNGKPVMKTGEYYSMKLARPTGLKPRDALNFGNKIIDEKIHPQKVIRKGIVRRSYRKAKK